MGDDGTAGGGPTRRVPVDGGALRPAHLRTAAMVVAAFVLIWAFTRLPLPDVSQLRAWAADLGPWFPIVFFLAYSTITVLPVPRTTFTFAAAFLFPPVIAIPIALGGLTVASSLGFLIGRRFGYARLGRLQSAPRMQNLDRHLSRRGWAAVLSLRMVPAVPFSVLNVTAALSSIRFGPYLVATVVGSAPNTVVAILLGESVNAESGVGATWALAGIAALGVLGLAIEARIFARGSRADTAGGSTVRQGTGPPGPDRA